MNAVINKWFWESQFIILLADHPERIRPRPPNEVIVKEHRCELEIHYMHSSVSSRWLPKTFQCFLQVDGKKGALVVHTAHDIQVLFSDVDCTAGIVMAMIKDELDDDCAEVNFQDQGKFTS